MCTGAAAFRRAMGCTAFGGVFWRGCRRELSRNRALRSDGCDEERQQRKNREQKDENGKEGHQGRPRGLRLRQAVIVIGLQFAPQLPQV
jgi:hypothetical protein